MHYTYHYICFVYLEALATLVPGLSAHHESAHHESAGCAFIVPSGPFYGTCRE